MTEVKPVLDKMICEGFYISNTLYDLVLQEAGETP
ncbi:MAG: DUF3368 domain-containing protein [Treponema sp.]|nr:DUF3368 domain-containing protein [Treponema sp.]